MSTTVHYVDRDAYLKLTKGEVVSDTSPEEQSFAGSITALREQINSARALLDKTQRELDALTLGGPTINRE